MTRRLLTIGSWVIGGLSLAFLHQPFGDGPLYAQGGQTPGRSIGTVSTLGALIVFELEDGALGRTSLFDLEKRTLRFTPAAGGYRVENVALEWDAEFGTEATEPGVDLRQFSFPFSGRSWNRFTVGVTGSIAFAERVGQTAGRGAGGGPGGAAAGGGRGGVSIGRFDQLQDAARALVNTQPAICVFMKPRMSGTRYVKELPDRVVVTWSLTEPFAGIQDFTWVPTVNRFQAVLHKDGTIQLSYDQLAAKDAIIGVFPLVNAGAERTIATVKSAPNASLPAHLDITGVRLGAVDGLFLKATFDLRGPALVSGDPALEGVSYEIAVRKGRPAAGAAAVESPDVVWTIRGTAGGGRGGRGRAPTGPRYVASGAGVSPTVTVRGNSISIQDVLPASLKTGDELTIVANTASGAGSAPADSVGPQPLKLAHIQSPEGDLSSLSRSDGPFPVIFETFHYLRLPNPRDLTCTVIQALGDQFDFLAYYSDFRIDNQEAGTPSTGPRGGGPDGGAVTGIGAAQRGLDSFCTAGRFQWQFVQPVYVGSNQMQELPPDGLTDTDRRNIGTYARQLGAGRPDGKLRPYNYGVSQIAHEMGHRWSAFVSAKIGTETIPLGPTHWARGLHAPAAFPYQRPTEASAMGGGVWQDNFDGTYTQLDDDYYVPATGWSHLELYMMGLTSASEVPDFFILRNLSPAGDDAEGRPMFKADRTKITIEDVIAAEGLRQPDVLKSQRHFNTGIVVMVEHGKMPSRELIERANGIREAWVEYFAITTGHRATMTTTVRVP